MFIKTAILAISMISAIAAATPVSAANAPNTTYYLDKEHPADMPLPTIQPDDFQKVWACKTDKSGNWKGNFFIGPCEYVYREPPKPVQYALAQPQAGASTQVLSTCPIPGYRPPQMRIVAAGYEPTEECLPPHSYVQNGHCYSNQCEWVLPGGTGGAVPNSTAFTSAPYPNTVIVEQGWYPERQCPTILQIGGFRLADCVSWWYGRYGYYYGGRERWSPGLSSHGAYNAYRRH